MIEQVLMVFLSYYIWQENAAWSDVLTGADSSKGFQVPAHQRTNR